MSSEIQKKPGPIDPDFVPSIKGSINGSLKGVIKDFSHYLHHQKKAGNFNLDISKSSEELINKWGTVQREENFFFEGPETASVFIVDSDTGFFKGESGELLVKILKATKLSPGSVFICNAGNIESIHQKIITISPDIIITLGTKAGQTLLNLAKPLKEFQGRFHDYHGIKVMPTFHPSLLLKHPEYKRKVWEDMKLVMDISR